MPARATGQSFVRFCVQRLLENSALLATGDIPGRLAGCCAAAWSSHLSRGLISADALELRECGCEVAAAWGGTQAFLEPPKSYGGTPPVTGLMCELSVWQTAQSSPRRTAEAASHVGQLSRLCLWSRTQST